MLTVLAILGVLVSLFLAAALATRDGEGLAPAGPDAADLALPEGPVGADDVRALRFSLAPRGYRMSEVDTALARLAADLEARDRRIAELEGTAAPAATDTGAPTSDAAFGADLDFPEVALPEEDDDPAAPDVSVGQAPVEPVDPPASLRTP